MDIGSRILIALKEEGLSRREFAHRLHINYNTVNGYIQNRRLPDCETLLQMSLLLNVSTDYLIGRTNIKHPKDLSFSHRESALIEHYRMLSPDMQILLLDISHSLYKNQHKTSFLWK